MLTKMVQQRKKETLRIPKIDTPRLPKPCSKTQYDGTAAKIRERINTGWKTGDSERQKGARGNG